MARHTLLGPLLLVVLAAGLGLRPSVRVQADDLVPLPGHVSPLLKQAKPLPPSAADHEPITLTLILKRTDPAGFAAFAAAVADPASPLFHHFLSPKEQAERFGPSQTADDSVLAYLKRYGFTAVPEASNRLAITVHGTRAEAEQAFHVTIGDFELGQETFYAATTDPSLPAAVAGYVKAVLGLDDLARPEPAGERNTTLGAPDPTPMAIATAYNFDGAGAGVTGAGQRIGLVEFDAFHMDDVTAWLAHVGLPATLANNVRTVPVNDGVARPQTLIGEGEVLLDIDVLLGMAPGAQIEVFEAPWDARQSSTTNYGAMFTVMVNDDVTIISNSWESCEHAPGGMVMQGVQDVLAEAAAGGISVLSATPDWQTGCKSGAMFFPGDPGFPADSPSGTAVGGTNLQTRPGNLYDSERWIGDVSPQNQGGGFGTSQIFARPAYQNALTSAAGRSVPDVVADGDRTTGIDICQADYAQNCTVLTGGDSMAAPIWAAGVARLNQKLGYQLGNLNPLLYRLANTDAFHSPASMDPPNNDFQHLGLGSFNLGDMAAFIPQQADELVVKVSPTGCGTVSAAGSSINVTRAPSIDRGVLVGDAVAVTASPCADNAFVQWQGGPCDGQSANPCRFAMPATRVAMTAAFVQQCSSVTPSFSPPSPQVVGTQVTITASAPFCPSPQFQFSLQDGGGTTVLQDWSTQSSATWDTTGRAADTETIIVSVKSTQTDTAPVAASAAYQLTLAPGACTSLGVTTTGSTTVPVGTRLQLAATVGGCDVPEYSVLVQRAGSPFWQRLISYPLSGCRNQTAGTCANPRTFQIDTTGWAPDTYTFAINARSDGSAAALEAEGTIGVSLQ